MPADLQRLPEQAEGIVGQGGHIIRRVAVFGLVSVDEFLGDRRGVVGGVVGAEVVAFAIRAAQLDQLGAAPGIAAQERDGDSQPVGLLDLQRHFAVIVGQEDHIRAGLFDLGQLGGEVLIAGGVGLEGDDLSRRFPRRSA